MNKLHTHFACKNDHQQQSHIFYVSCHPSSPLSPPPQINYGPADFIPLSPLHDFRDNTPRNDQLHSHPQIHYHSRAPYRMYPRLRH